MLRAISDAVACASGPRLQSASCALGLLFAASGCGVASNGLNAEGTRYFQGGQQHVAIEKFQQAIAADRTNPDSYYNLAAAYHQMATLNHDPTNYGQAEQYYHQCLDVDANHVDCQRGLAVLLVEQKRSDEALRRLQEWARRSPTSADARVELARLSQELGDRPQAEKQLLEAIAIDPRNSRARAALGKLRDDAGDYSQALVNYNASLEANRVQPQIAARVAALGGAMATAPALSAGIETRLATVSPPSFR